MEIGRVVLVNYGPDYGKLATVIDVVDGNKVRCACACPYRWQREREERRGLRVCVCLFKDHAASEERTGRAGKFISGWRGDGHGMHVLLLPGGKECPRFQHQA